MLRVFLLDCINFGNRPDVSLGNFPLAGQQPPVSLAHLLFVAVRFPYALADRSTLAPSHLYFYPKLRALVPSSRCDLLAYTLFHKAR